MNSKDVQLVVFKMNGNYFGVNILEIQEIIKYEGTTKLPNSPEYIKGLVNLRGKIIPVMDLRKRFGIEKSADIEKPKIIVLKSKNSLTGILVDDISQVEKIPKATIEEPPKLVSGIKKEFIIGIAKKEDSLLVLLDVLQLLCESEKEELEEVC